MLKYFVKLVVLIVAVGVGRLAYEKATDLAFFALEDVKINSNGYCDPDTIIGVSGLEKGKSIFKQDVKFAADMISKRNGVVSCIVDRGILSDVNVDIEFAEPRLLISAGKVYGLSKEGIVLPVNEMTPDLPLVTGRQFRGARSFEILRDPDIAYALDLYDVIKSFSPGLGELLSEIHFRDSKSIIVYFSPEGTSAVLDKRYTKNDILRLCALSKSGMLKGRKIFDLRFGDIVVESSKERGTL